LAFFSTLFPRSSFPPTRVFHFPPNATAFSFSFPCMKSGFFLFPFSLSICLFFSFPVRRQAASIPLPFPPSIMRPEIDFFFFPPPSSPRCWRYLKRSLFCCSRERPLDLPLFSFPPLFPGAAFLLPFSFLIDEQVGSDFFSVHAPFSSIAIRCSGFFPPLTSDRAFSFSLFFPFFFPLPDVSGRERRCFFFFSFLFFQ